MSMLECNIVSGDGDGFRCSFEKPIVKRSPVPSCRRFATRHQPKNQAVKTKLGEALRQVTPPKPVNYNRKRAQTMAEITPSKKKTTFLKLAGDGATRAPPREEDAGRRVCQQLLLNAWRRRREQVATLSDSSRRLQAQALESPEIMNNKVVGRHDVTPSAGFPDLVISSPVLTTGMGNEAPAVEQLQIQVDVLQKLRESEGRRRSEAANESLLLKNKLENLVKTLELLKQEKIIVNEHVAHLEQKIESLNADTQNVRNEMISCKSEIAAYEHQLTKERQRTNKLREEKISLIRKISEYEGISAEQKETIHKLRISLDIAEKDLECASLNSSALEDSKSQLTLKLETETGQRSNLEKQFIETKMREGKLERRVLELKRNVNMLNEAKNKLNEDNKVLKDTLDELEEALKVETDKTWWKNAASAVYESIQSAAHIMLPAYPNPSDDGSTSTEDVDLDQ